MKLAISTVASLAVLASSAMADDCNGKPGWVLTAPDTIAIGATIDVDLAGPANEMALLMVSLGEGPVKTGYGTICLDFPLVLSVPLTLDAAGVTSISGDIPCDPSLVGITFYTQFITCRPNKGVSNQHPITVTDGVCSGDLCTFTQGGWGT